MWSVLNFRVEPTSAISCPCFKISSGFVFLAQDISETCNNPWTPPKSTKAPYVLKLETVPLYFFPTSTSDQNLFNFSCFSSSNILFIEPITFLFFISYSVIRNLTTSPLYSSTFSFLGIPDKDNGINTLISFIFTISPFSFTSVTVSAST